MPRLIALQRFEYDRRVLIPGDHFEAPQPDADLLIGCIGGPRARLAPDNEEPLFNADAIVRTPRRRRREGA